MKRQTKQILQILAWIAGAVAILISLYGTLRSFGVLNWILSNGYLK